MHFLRCKREIFNHQQTLSRMMLEIIKKDVTNAILRFSNLQLYDPKSDKTESLITRVETNPSRLLSVKT